MSKTPTKNKVRYAVVPRGVAPCEQCILHASRGFVYHYEFNPHGHKNHNCHCKFMPGYKDTRIEGYDPNEYYEKYRNPDYEIKKGLSGYKKIEHTLSIEDACKNSNNLNKYNKGNPEYTMNCQRCVVASELRRRGYDVEAMPRIFPDSKDTIRSKWQYYFKSQKWERAMNSIQIENKAKDYPIGARGTVYIEWKKGGAHVFCFEKTKKGMKYYCPQSGKIKYNPFNRKKKNKPMYFSRVDNLEIDENYLPYLVKERK